MLASDMTPDFAVARNLVMLGFERADVITVLLHGSAKADEMNQDRASSYVNRTVDQAFGFAAKPHAYSTCSWLLPGGRSRL